jgi:RES domain-containing protein
LAVLEYRVHTDENPDDLLMYTIEIPDALHVEKLTWTPDIATSRHFGDTWVKTTRSPILSVPSVVVPHQVNYLINPEHPDIVGSIKVVEQ